MTMDLKALKDYLIGLGDPLTLSVDDKDLPEPVQDFIKTMPGGKVKLAPGAGGITLSDNDTLLTVTGTSTDVWAVQGMTDVSVTLSSITLTVTVDTVSGVLEGGMDVTPQKSFDVTVASVTEDSNPWRIKLKEDATGASTLELLLLGNEGSLPFDIPPELEPQLNLGATVSSDTFAITFYPNTTYGMYYTLGLEIKVAKWTPIEGVLSFDGISVWAFIKPNSFSVVLSTDVTIGTVGMKIGVSMNGGENWTAFVRPANGKTFPGPVDLAEWACGKASGGDLTTAFANVDFDINGFGLAISDITLGFNWKAPKVNYLKITSLITVKALKLDVILTLPDIEIYGTLHGNEPLNVLTMLESFGVGTGGVPSDMTIKTATLDARPRSSFYEASMEIDNLWHAGPVSFDEVKVMVAYNGQDGFSGEFDCLIGINNNGEVGLTAEYNGAGQGWTFTGRTANGTTLKVGDVIQELSGSFGITRVPGALSSLILKDIFVQYATQDGSFIFSCTGDFTVSDTPVEVTFTINITHTKAADEELDGTIVGEIGYSATFGGKVTFADLEFDIIFNTQSTGVDMFVADYQYTGKESEVKLKDLVAGVSPELAKDIPDDISIGLKAVKFAFLEDEEDEKKTKHFLFGVELGADIGLTSLPLIGDKLPKEATVEFNELQFAYAKPAFTKEQAALVNPLLPEGLIKIPEDGLAQGILISTNLQLGDKNKMLSLTIPTGGSSEDANADTKEAALAVAAPVSSSSPKVAFWINVQKQFGPVGIQKIGLEYKDARLFVVGDITLTAQVLVIGLLGVGIGSKINKFDPAATIDGLTITVAEGPLAVSGGLYGTIKPLNFDGALMVRMPSMTIGALGGYAQLGSNPSFFMYLAINRPLIGYPYFFLDGIAGGLGFNRDLMIPDIDGVASFPLVKWAVGGGPSTNPAGNIAKQINDVLDALAADIPPKIGEYWVAAGIKFSSFKVLNSFALVTLAFGTDFKIALLGLSNASLPPNAGEGVPPIGYVEMALKVAFSPETGILEVAAKLTPASYILTSACHLTGGFAYFMWFKDNPDADADGYHAGDFVVTLGGYNPAYKKPTYFPTEPLLGLNWRVDGNTSIKGGIYFAMTPSALMAGGRLEALWHSGDLKAWFTAHADFMLSWKPFHYEARIGLSIGVSYKLNLLFTTKTISVHLGVDLSLWGPAFGGKIHVDLTVISFTVSIGNRTKPAAKAISWSDFKTSFLPANSNGLNSFSAGDATPIETDSYCLSSVSAGLVKDLSTSKAAPTDPDWVVNAETLEFITMTALPTKSAKLITAGKKESPLPAGAVNFGVGPVGVSVDDFSSEHTITVNRMNEGMPDTSFNLADHATIEPVKSNLPNGTWGGKIIINPSISDINKTPDKISGLTVGYSIKMKPRAPDHTPLPIDISILQQECEGMVDFEWATPTIPTTDTFDQSKAMETFQSSLKEAVSARADILNALVACGLDVDTDVDIDKLAKSADTVLWNAPVLSYLGEERAQ